MYEKDITHLLKGFKWDGGAQKVLHSFELGNNVRVVRENYVTSDWVEGRVTVVLGTDDYVREVRLETRF